MRVRAGRQRGEQHDRVRGDEYEWVSVMIDFIDCFEKNRHVGSVAQRQGSDTFDDQ